MSNDKKSIGSIGLVETPVGTLLVRQFGDCIIAIFQDGPEKGKVTPFVPK